MNGCVFWNGSIVWIEGSTIYEWQLKVCVCMRMRRNVIKADISMSQIRMRHRTIRIYSLRMIDEWPQIPSWQWFWKKISKLRCNCVIGQNRKEKYGTKITEQLNKNQQTHFQIQNDSLLFQCANQTEEHWSDDQRSIPNSEQKSVRFRSWNGIIFISPWINMMVLRLLKREKLYAFRCVFFCWCFLLGRWKKSAYVNECKSKQNVSYSV